MRRRPCVRNRSFVSKLAFGIVSLAATLLCHAQSPTADSFNPGLNGLPAAFAVRADGLVFVGGDFVSLAGQTRSGIGRLLPDGSLDTGFRPEANGAVYCLAIQDNNSILVGGSFSTFGGQPLNRIARLNPDGTVDPSFNPGADGDVLSLIPLADGRILAAGFFRTVGGLTRNHVALLNSDGSVAAFNPDVNGVVNSLAVQPDGRVLVGGLFTRVGGQTRNFLAQLYPDGSLDETFNAPANNQVNTLAIQADGAIVVGGWFTTLAGQPRNRLARLNPDGTMDFSFNPGANNPVRSVAVQADGRIVVGGIFTTLGGQPRNHIARLNSDGSIDFSFNPGADGNVYALALQPDGKILAGGDFSTLGGKSRSRIGRLNNTDAALESLTFDGSWITWYRDGTAPEAWRTAFDASTNGINWFPLGPGERIAGGWQLAAPPIPGSSTIRARAFSIGGNFNGSGWFAESIIGPPAISIQPANRTNNAATIARFAVAAGGTLPLTYQWRKNGVDLADGGNLYGTGSAILTLNNVHGADAADYSVVVTGTSGSVTSLTATLTVLDPVITSQPLSQSIRPGGTASFSAVAVGTEPLTFQWHRNGADLPGETNATLALTPVSASDVGSYQVVVTNVFGRASSSVVSLTVNQSMLDTFNPGADQFVNSIALQPDGRILVAGAFGAVGAQPNTRFIARLNSDATPDTTFNAGASDAVNCLIAQPDGRILVGGRFTVMGEQPRTALARLNSDGSVESAFRADAGGVVNCLVAQADGSILVGGAFTNLAGLPRNYLGRLAPDGSPDLAFDPGPNSTVNSLAVQPDGKILLGGSFTNLAGQPRNHIGRLNPNGSLDAAFNPGADGPGASVNSIVIQPDGKIIVGGLFTTLGAQPRRSLGRLNADGSLDPTFNPGTDGTVFCLVQQANGRILVCGSFGTLAGLSRSSIGRLDPDGTADWTFDPAANGWVTCAAVAADGQILLGGWFSAVDGQARNRIARLNNTEPATQSLSFDGSNIVWERGGSSPEIWRATFEACTNGVDWVILGAGQRIPDGWQRTGLNLPVNATIRARGFVRGGYGNGSGWFLDSSVGKPAILVQPLNQTNHFGEAARLSVSVAGSIPLNYQWRKDDVPLVDGGSVSGTHTPTLVLSNLFGGDTAGYSVVISNSQGSVTSRAAAVTVVDPWITLQPVSQSANVGAGVTFSVEAIGTPPFTYDWLHDGLNLVGASGPTLTLSNLSAGDIGRYQVSVASRFSSTTSALALLTVNLVDVDSFERGPGDFVTAIAVQADGKVLVVGSGGPAAVQRLTSEGTPEISLSAAATGYLPGLSTIAVQEDGKVLVGGSFTFLGGESIARLGRLSVDGTVDTSFNPGATGDAYGGPQTITPQPDGRILVGGSFFFLGGVPRNYLGRLNESGSLDTSFNPAASDVVTTIALQRDGAILAGSHRRLVRIAPDGTVDPTFNPGVAFEDFVLALAVQADDKILVGGVLSTLGAQPRSHLGRLNADGSLDASFNPGANGTVFCFALQADGKILVGGEFTRLGGELRNHIGRLNPDGSVDLSFDPGANSFIYSLAVQADGRILVGGTFTELAGQPRNYLGRLRNSAHATQSLTRDGPVVSWMRGGTSPEVWRTHFDASTNGVDWINLGDGERVPGGWRLAGLSVPTNAIIHARGFVTAKSSWFVETTLWPSTNPGPTLNVSRSGNLPLLTMTGDVGKPYALEYVPALTLTNSWQPLATLLLTNSPQSFLDSSAGSITQRFYRVRFNQ